MFPKASSEELQRKIQEKRQGALFHSKSCKRIECSESYFCYEAFVYEMTVSAFKAKLDVLGCPFIENSTEIVARELLFTPGEHRLRLLQWILGKIDGNIYNHIDRQPKYGNKGIDDWRIQNILSLTTALGLSSRCDIDVIMGSAPEEKQSVFYDRLLNLAIVMDRVDFPERSAGGSILKEQYTRDAAFLTQAIAQNSKTNAFPHGVSLLPLDLNRLVQENWKEKAWKVGDRPPLPDRKHLCGQLTKLTDQLEKERASLEQVQSKGFVADKLDETSKSCLRSRYSVVLSGLIQILTDFSYSYANDMEVWCGCSEIVGEDESDFGPSVRQANKVLQSIVALINDLNCLTSLSKELLSSSSVKVVTKKLDTLESIANNFSYSRIIACERNDNNIDNVK